jgi:uncharacterized protein YbgA (DUF1722 family)
MGYHKKTIEFHSSYYFEFSLIPNYVLSILEEFLERIRTRAFGCLILKALPDIRKTQFIRAFLEYKRHFMVFVSNTIKGLQHFDSNFHTAIFFDNPNLKKTERDTILQLVDNNEIYIDFI